MPRSTLVNNVFHLQQPVLAPPALQDSESTQYVGDDGVSIKNLAQPLHHHATKKRSVSFDLLGDTEIIQQSDNDNNNSGWYTAAELQSFRDAATRDAYQYEHHVPQSTYALRVLHRAHSDCKRNAKKNNLDWHERLVHVYHNNSHNNTTVLGLERHVLPAIATDGAERRAANLALLWLMEQEAETLTAADVAALAQELSRKSAPAVRYEILLAAALHAAVQRDEEEDDNDSYCSSSDEEA